VPELPSSGERIASTALAFAHHDEGNQKPRAVYANRFADVLNLPADNPAVEWDDSPETDCGVFVAFVMHESGVDQNYPSRETDVQLKYLLSNSKPGGIYQRVNGVTDSSQLLPGDILIFSRTFDTFGTENPADDDKDGHTFIYTGDPGKDGTLGTDDDILAVSASWQSSPPERSSAPLTQVDRTGTEQKFLIFRHDRIDVP
jgi:hypothetical protein